MNIIVKKGLRVTGIVILVMGVLGLIMELVADLYDYPAHYSGAVILIVFGISLYWAAGPKEKKEAEKPSTDSEIADDKEPKSFTDFVWYLSRVFKRHIEPLFDIVTDNIDWPIHLSSKPFFEKHKIISLVTSVVGGIFWLLSLPYLAVSFLMAIVPGIIIGAILYLFGVSEKSASKVFICIVAVCFLFVILRLID